MVFRFKSLHTVRRGWLVWFQIGMQQQFANGQYLRKRYDGFIDRTYKHDQVRRRRRETGETRGWVGGGGVRGKDS